MNLIYYAATLIISLFILQQGYTIGKFKSAKDNYLLGIICSCLIILLTYAVESAGLLCV